MAAPDQVLERELRRMAVLHARELAALRRGGRQRRPNTAVPIRTIVAPHAIASSRSPLMPIES